jgi:predicted regulator of Ras-like GTPase activity (Roadblock/LC7/MglB family)
MPGSMLRCVDAAQALADLTEISSQVVHVAIVDGDGTVLATTIDDAGRAGRFVRGVTTLLQEADDLRQARGLPGLSQLEAATLEGSVFVVRREAEDGSTRIIAATTRPDPTVGLVFYDLKHCLRSIEDSGAATGTRRRTRKKAGDTA